MFSGTDTHKHLNSLPVYTNDIKFDSLHLTLLGLGEIESQNTLWRKAGNMCDANNNFKSLLSQLFSVSSAQRNGTRYYSLVHNYELFKIFTPLVCILYVVRWCLVTGMLPYAPNLLTVATECHYFCGF